MERLQKVVTETIKGDNTVEHSEPPPVFWQIVTAQAILRIRVTAQAGKSVLKLA
jgi:hypothetical protein